MSVKSSSDNRETNPLLSGFRERSRYCKLIEEEVDGIVWRTGFRRGCGSVVRRTAVC